MIKEESLEMEKVKVMEDVLGKNNIMAEELRKIYRNNGLQVLNLIGSPGEGKTTLLETTLRHLSGRILPGVIEGDILTGRDAARIKKLGRPVVQIETRGACHLDAKMIAKVLKDFDLQKLNLLLIENVGNLVCPASFDLGEDFKVVVISAVEGSDKPGKYPEIFNRAGVCVLNKVDLIGYTNFSREEFYEDIEHVNPQLKVFELSATNGTGVEKWVDWLEGLILNGSKKD
jgi:hydrogenase nickel incorporation protein HypB